MTEEELESYLYKNVRIICIDGDILEGYVSCFSDAEDNASGEADIILENEKKLNREVSVSLSEIQFIEVIEE